jgi:hypothetical protein
MDTRKLHEQARALEDLHQWKITGEHAPTLSHEVQGALLAERLVHVDEYGDIQITERGEEHLRHLKMEGRLLPDRSSTKR